MQAEQIDPGVGIARVDTSIPGQLRHWLEDSFQSISVRPLEQAEVERLDSISNVLIFDCLFTDQHWSESLANIDLYRLKSPIVLLSSEKRSATPFTPEALGVDIWLSEPINTSAFTESVERLYINECYGDVLDAYVTLVRRWAEIDGKQSTDGITESSEYQVLMSKLDQISDSADIHRDQVIDQFDHRVFKHIAVQKQ